MADLTLRERVTLLTRLVFFLGNNRVTAAGAVLTTASGLTMVGFWALEVLQLRHVHPYAGIILFLVLPGVFVAGLVLMPLGVLLRRRRLRAKGALPQAYPRIDLHEPAWRHGLALVGVATLANVAILSTASYKGVEHMDSTQFCGLTCHSVMAPEYTAYLESPHSRVTCVECHIGPGADWFVRSKLSGTRQVFAVAFDTHSRPIPSPVQHLRPARETCEQCHWPQKFHGDKFLVRTKFADDEANTKTTTVLVLKVGGRAFNGATGIHGRHLDEKSRIEYVAIDDKRQVIAQVSYVNDRGERELYESAEVKATPEQIAKGERRSMDCMDCHNRPSHTFELPERAVDQAMAEGSISPALPFAKKKAVELLRAEYPDRDTAVRRIREGFTEYYRASHPQAYAGHRALVETSAERLAAIYLKNVFPAMKVSWGTYPNNIGHEDFLGCFRCHDESHKTRDGRTISQDCSACHSILAMEEPNPKVLADLGLQ
ncbi:MAG TPA: NapC/NirT family cytochrome c [Vicinamibacteria bacterium]|nr:NapC/NirT family cytochrome c [Vicinamibacteria bacterium]